MSTSYNFLRPQKASTFDLEQFKLTLESMKDFSNQLEFWNEFFDLSAMGRELSVRMAGLKRLFHFYCDYPGYLQGFTPERQEILTNWRRQHFAPVKVSFDQLTNYQERLVFKVKHFDTISNTLSLEGIEFNAAPETEKDRQLYDQLSYERWEKQWLTSSAFDINKAFESRKEQFEKRIVNTLHPNEELQKEIDSIRNEYEQPSKKLSQNKNSDTQVWVFRNRLSGYDRTVPQQTDRLVFGIPKFIEGQQAYQYYKYLVELRQNPNWQKALQPVDITGSTNNDIHSAILHTIKPSSPIIFIKPESRNALFIAFAPFVMEAQHLDLNNLLSNGSISSHIVVRHQQGSIAYVFRQLIEAEHCDVDKTKMRDWILYWFRVYDGEYIKALSASTVYDALSKDKKPAKNNRIPYIP